MVIKNFIYETIDNKYYFFFFLHYMSSKLALIISLKDHQTIVRSENQASHGFTYWFNTKTAIYI